MWAASFGCRWRVSIPFLFPTTLEVAETRKKWIIQYICGYCISLFVFSSKITMDLIYVDDGQTMDRQKSLLRQYPIWGGKKDQVFLHIFNKKTSLKDRLIQLYNSNAWHHLQLNIILGNFLYKISFLIFSVKKI